MEIGILDIVVPALVTIMIWAFNNYIINRPYLEVTFELVRDSLACIVVRNVGSTPLQLTSLKFNRKFTKQLDETLFETLKNKENMDIVVAPGRYWVISFDKPLHKVLEFEETVLKIQYEYKSTKKKFKKYKEKTAIDFKEYGSFLLYLSEVDELKNAIKNSSANITKVCDKIARKM